MDEVGCLPGCAGETSCHREAACLTRLFVGCSQSCRSLLTSSMPFAHYFSLLMVAVVHPVHRCLAAHHLGGMCRDLTEFSELSFLAVGLLETRSAIR